MNRKMTFLMGLGILFVFAGFATFATAHVYYSSDPSSGDHEVPINQAITITYDVTLDASSISKDRFKMWDGAHYIDGEVQFNESERTITFTPTANLTYGTRYSLMIDTVSLKWEEKVSNVDYGNDVISFVTEYGPNVPPFEVLSTCPADGAGSVSYLNPIVTINFPRDVDPDTFDGFSLVGNTSGNVNLPGDNITYEESDGSLSIHLETELVPGETYTVSFSNACDYAGNCIDGGYSWAFTVGEQVSSWRITDVELPKGTDKEDDLKRVSVSSDGRAFAIGKSYLLNYNGATWTAQSIENFDLDYDLDFYSLYDVMALNDAAIVVGYPQIQFEFDYFNTEWTRRPDFENALQVTDLFQLQGEPYGFEWNSILQYDPAFKTWSSVVDLRDVSFFGNNIWGTSLSNLYSFTSEGDAQHYDGVSSEMIGQDIRDMDGLSASNMYELTQFAIYNFDGVRTSPFYQSPKTTFQLNRLYVQSSTNMYAIGQDGLILHYNGVGWSQMYSGTTKDLYDIEGTSANNIFAVGEDGIILQYAGLSGADPPQVISTTPTNGADDASAYATISAQFSETMDASTLNSTTFAVNDGSSNIAGEITYSGGIATFTPSVSLTYNTTYTATLTTEVKDIAGNALSQNRVWTFTVKPGATLFTIAGDENACMAQGANWTYNDEAIDNLNIYLSDATSDGLVDQIRFYLQIKPESSHAYSSDSWYIEFETNQLGQNLTSGSYVDAVYNPDEALPGFHLSDGVTTEAIEASFKIIDIEVDYSGSEPKLVRFAATYSQCCYSCQDTTPNTGGIYYNYTFPPDANAGSNQTIMGNSTVTLNGSDSTDVDNGIVAYLWSQTNGPSVTLSDDTAANPTFTAPDVGQAGDTLAFQLKVTDSGGLESTDTVQINVTWDGDPPIADAGPDQNSREKATVTLDANHSSDPNDGIASYSWVQTAGTSVTLSDNSNVHPTFTCPNYGDVTDTLTFQLTVTDNGGLQSTDTVNIVVIGSNDPPIANAGDDQSVEEGPQVRLNGSLSSDPEGTNLTYHWEQISGTPVSLSASTAIQPYFDTPDVDSAGAILTFQLTVTDSDGGQASDTVIINVTWDRDKPVADAGEARNVNPGATVTLDASGSTDPNDGIAGYQWEQIDGEPVTLRNATSPQCTFTAPDSSGLAFTFKLTVTDTGGLQSTDTVRIATATDNTGDTSTSQEASNTTSINREPPTREGSGDIGNESGCFINTLITFQ